MDGDANPRDRLLRDIWDALRSLDESNVTSHPAARRAVDDGATPHDLVRAMTAASYEVVFEVLSAISDVVADDEAGAATTLAGLHEDLLAADPTGQEAADLFE